MKVIVTGAAGFIGSHVSMRLTDCAPPIIVWPLGKKMINSQWIRGGCITAAFFMAAMIFLRADTGTGIPLPAPWDKLAHFLYYGTMALLLSHGVGRRWLWIPLVLVPVIGAADEWHQAGIPGRDSSVLDWLADEIGTLVAVYVYYRWSERREKRQGHTHMHP